MNLNYKGQNLFVDNTSVKSIAKNNITPFYVYSHKKIKNNFEIFSNYFKKINPLVCFSVKSNSNVSLIYELAKLGSGADVVSEGELLKALKARIRPNKITKIKEINRIFFILYYFYTFLSFFSHF